MLIQGDNLPVMALLREHLSERFALIYADPPFSTVPGSVSGEAQSGTRANSQGEADAPETASPIRRYSGYLHSLHPRLLLTHELLRPGGTLVFHAGRHIAHYVRVLLDEVFGLQSFAGEVLWCRWSTTQSRRRCLVWDSLLAYRKEGEGSAHPRRHVSERPPWPSGMWRDIAAHPESADAPFPKPEQLLERIISLTADEGELVGDFFCGSGTTLVVAARLRRAWIGRDARETAISETTRRLASLPESCEFSQWFVVPSNRGADPS